MLLNQPKSIPFLNSNFRVRILLQWASFSNLKVHWRKDEKLDTAIQADKKWRLCARVVKEVLNEPGQFMPLQYLENRRTRLKLNVKAKTFLHQNPLLFDTYYDRIKPKSQLLPFIRPSNSLRRLLQHEEFINTKNEPLIVAKLCKMLMMAENRAINVEKLVHVKREFGFPNDFLSKIVPRYPQYFRLVGGSQEKPFLELVGWETEFARSVIMQRAEDEEKLTGIKEHTTGNNFDLRTR